VTPQIPRRKPKVTPKVALVQLDSVTGEILRKAFEQCKIHTIDVGEDFAKRVGMEQFQGCVVRLDDGAPPVLEAVRSSRSNRQMIVYGLTSENADLRRFFKYGINAVLDFPLDRMAVLTVARSTCALLLNELRRYVRVPLVIEVAVETRNGKVSGSSREVSGGGMSVRLTGQSQLSDKLRLFFTLPDKPFISIGATACWQKGGLTGFQFDTSDPVRQIVRDWINSFLGLD